MLSLAFGGGLIDTNIDVKSQTAILNFIFNNNAETTDTPSDSPARLADMVYGSKTRNQRQFVFSRRSLYLGKKIC